MGVFWVNLLEVNANFMILFEVPKSANISPPKSEDSPASKIATKSKRQQN